MDGSLLRVTKLGIGLGLGSINQSINICTCTDRSLSSFPCLLYPSFFRQRVVVVVVQYVSNSSEYVFMFTVVCVSAFYLG
jgi:hypothetical protein